ncbi:MAG: smalltalk protein [Bacteroidales bacterium]|nr:smalltalk protein [Bacteroidales bacterium]
MKNLFSKRASRSSDATPDPIQDSPKKVLWKFIIQTIISILTAILTALGASSCVHHMM